MGEMRGNYAKEVKIETDLGIGTNAIYRRKKELGEVNLRAFPWHGNPFDGELFRFRKEPAEVQEERDILRKAAGNFSKPKK
jgi:hypothetical protein